MFVSENNFSVKSRSLIICCELAVGRHAGVELSIRETRRFQMEELSLATKNFSDKNLIGEGKFGEVYMGFLHDGMLVAIKKRPGLPSQEFINEVIVTFPTDTGERNNFFPSKEKKEMINTKESC